MSTSLLRQLIFTYLYNDAEVKNVADVVLTYPTGGNINKSKIVVFPLHNTALGKYVTQEIENPEIQITCYCTENLDLTKHGGLHDLVHSKMKNVHLPTVRYNHHLIREIREDYIPQLNCYISLQIYRFYLTN